MTDKTTDTFDDGGLLAVIVAFAAGAMIVLLTVLAAKNESLRRDIIRLEAKAEAAERGPQIVIVKGGSHE